MSRAGEDSELFSGRLLFSTWPRPGLNCPICQSATMSLVSVRLRRGRRETVFDATGVHVHTALAAESSLALAFRCPAHESVLCMAPAPDGRVAATVECRPASASRRPLWDEPDAPIVRRRPGAPQLRLLPRPRPHEE